MTNNCFSFIILVNLQSKFKTKNGKKAMVPEKKKTLTFKEFYQSLKETDKTVLRDDIIRECGISYPTFYSKLNKGNYTNLEKKEIERLSKQTFQW